MLDNASDDGSADAVAGMDREIRLIALDRRQGKAANDSRLIEEARGEFCLLLNEDSELQPGAVPALVGALRAGPAGGGRRRPAPLPRGRPVPCAWRLPSAGTALAGALFLHRRFTVESGGDATRPVGWVQSSAMLVRREAALQVGGFDPGFFVYSDETDFCKRLSDAGWRILYVPSARAIHHDQMAQDAAGAERRIVEYHRGRDRYLRKHLGRAAGGPASPAARLALPAAGSRCRWFSRATPLAATGCTPARR